MNFVATQIFVAKLKKKERNKKKEKKERKKNLFFLFKKFLTKLVTISDFIQQNKKQTKNKTKNKQKKTNKTKSNLNYTIGINMYINIQHKNYLFLEEYCNVVACFSGTGASKTDFPYCTFPCKP